LTLRTWDQLRTVDEQIKQAYNIEVLSLQSGCSDDIIDNLLVSYTSPAV